MSMRHELLAARHAAYHRLLGTLVGRVSGPESDPELVARTLDRLPHAALQNLYGPTEASIDVTWWP